ncbi:MAG: hypothetical protein U0L49_01410 [Eubacterium sp.]|nr:hypothetical protein [Eubacterium sp.]
MFIRFQRFGHFIGKRLELAGRGCFVIAGRIDRKYFYDQFYRTSGGAAHKAMADEEDIDNDQSAKTRMFRSIKSRLGM